MCENSATIQSSLNPTKLYKNAENVSSNKYKIWELPGPKAISFSPGCETFVGILDSLKQTWNSLETSESEISKSS